MKKDTQDRGIPAGSRCYPDHRKGRYDITFATQSKNYPESIALHESGAINIAPLVTHQFPLEQIYDAFVIASKREQGVVKAVLRI